MNSPRRYLGIPLGFLLIMTLACAYALGADDVFVLTLAALAIAVVLAVLISFFYCRVFVFTLGVVYAILTISVVTRLTDLGWREWVTLLIWLLFCMVAVILVSPMVALADRRAARRGHKAVARRRRRFARRNKLRYQAVSARVAEDFGGWQQDVPRYRRFVRHDRHLAQTEATDTATSAWDEDAVRRAYLYVRHAAELTAESVTYFEAEGRPGVTFDLGVLDQFTLETLRNVSYRSLAAIDRHYLSVCAVSLPAQLPFVASAFAWDTTNYRLHQRQVAEGVGRMREVETPDDEARIREAAALTTESRPAAEILMSVPAVREAALDATLPWFVDGNRLVGAVTSRFGADPDLLGVLATRLVSLVQDIPWSALDRYHARSPEHYRRRSLRFYRTFPPDGDPNGGPTVQRWEMRRVTRSGLYCPVLTDELRWGGPPAAGRDRAAVAAHGHR